MVVVACASSALITVAISRAAVVIHQAEASPAACHHSVRYARQAAPTRAPTVSASGRARRETAGAGPSQRTARAAAAMTSSAAREMAAPKATASIAASTSASRAPVTSPGRRAATAIPPETPSRRPPSTPIRRQARSAICQKLRPARTGASTKRSTPASR